ncbi:pilus assembly protein CpaF [Solimonas aquatica]|uniref:Pilus assembly protein CpaF n=1 Tax=Solimonas aquatica TaxID=489703 RepID=A0A1H9MJR2_9GAMM|nr:ATPase, T2SS/T4P/T4SS family [Solimonas aquatica]SER23942.1 pilus assembly protein CpaF [Solimonas aquatica]
MIEVEVTESSGRRSQVQVPDDCTIGKGGRSHIRLESWRVAKEHARLLRTPAGIVLGSLASVTVNDIKVDGQYGPLQDKDIIGIASYRIRILASGDSGAAPGVPTSAADIGIEDDQSSLAEPTSSDTGLENEPELPALRALEFEWRRRLHGKLLEALDLRRHDVRGMSDEHLRQQAEILLKEIIGYIDDEVPKLLNRDVLCRQVINEAIGLGPLEELLGDETVTEIMVNRYDQIYVERNGRLQRYPMMFTGEAAVMGVIERIVAPLGRRIDESSPMVDARLKDGSRVNAIIPPLALKGSTLTIRKFAKRKLEAADLVRFGSLSTAMAEFLKICVQCRKNIVVSGGTGSGKTTLLNILSNFIPSAERVITVEDAAELKLHHEHLVSLEARPANVEGKGGVLIRDLVRNTLRMRPDRIVIGECRGAEALDMLQAMNTGHDGSLTTLHANSPRDALARLETMVLMAGMDLPLSAIREQVSGAVDIIVQQTRYTCGTRLVTHIVEVTGMESGRVQLQDLFRFVAEGYGGQDGRIQGAFTGCDLVPSFYEELRAAGQPLDLGIFKPGAVTSREARQ